MTSPRSLRTTIALAAVLAAAWSAAAAGDNWPRFRGEDGSGVVEQKGLPVTWSASDYAWNIELPGVGHASPVIWDEKLFITSSLGEGSEGGEIRLLFCLDAATGKEQWSRSIGTSSTHRHLKNSWASSTPAVDGERVYVAFADEENFYLSAYDFDGELVWRRNLGPFQSQHGLGVSPIVFEELVIIPNDQDGPSSVVAFDRRTGRTVWSTLRVFNTASYATPLVIRHEGGPPQLICSAGSLGISSLNPHTGRTNWATGPLPEPSRT
ncbi:MAG: PQQ-like beta-propeller repeat protein, partial [Planctomycetes bacterium]|nr:PQQ-like beta-propeller repeat protein [Planctomycetota bacterium]